MQGLIAHLSDSGVPSILVALDKTYVSVPRLLHFLALVYLLSVTGLVRTLASSDIASPVRVIGRHSLPVFAFSTVPPSWPRPPRTSTPRPRSGCVADRRRPCRSMGLRGDARLLPPTGGHRPARAAASPALPVGIGSARP